MPKKSPFASVQAEIKTYVYPAPWDPDKKDDDGEYTQRSLIDPEVLFDADGNPQPPNDLPWIKVRVPRTAADADRCADFTQAVAVSGNGDGPSFESRVARMNRGLFALLVEDWSFTERKPSADDYDKLESWAATWVRVAIGDAHREGTSLDFQWPVPSSSTSVEPSPVESSAV